MLTHSLTALSFSARNEASTLPDILIYFLVGFGHAHVVCIGKHPLFFSSHSTCCSSAVLEDDAETSESGEESCKVSVHSHLPICGGRVYYERQVVSKEEWSPQSGWGGGGGCGKQRTIFRIPSQYYWKGVTIMQVPVPLYIFLMAAHRKGCLHWALIFLNGRPSQRLSSWGSFFFKWPPIAKAVFTGLFLDDSAFWKLFVAGKAVQALTNWETLWMSTLQWISFLYILLLTQSDVSVAFNSIEPAQPNCGLLCWHSNGKFFFNPLLR